jgi:hypothetical protein
LREDPVGFDSDINFYRGMANNPVMFADPTGLNKVGSKTIEKDLRRAVNIIALNSKCGYFIQDLLKKAFEQENKRVHQQGSGISPDTYRKQWEAQDLGRFVTNMIQGDYVFSNSHRDYGAHVDDQLGPVHIDLGYGGPVDLIHETFHRTPYGFSDRELADALGLPYKIDPRNAQTTTNNASTAWNCKLEDARK